MIHLTTLHHIFTDATEALPDISIGGVCADSRTVQPGDIFVALPGVKTDGARYAGDAAAKGAAAIVAATGADIGAPGVPVIRTRDPHRALALLAAAFHGPQPEIVVAVTGTAGKTSVAAFTRQIFAHAGHQAASIGTTGVESPNVKIEGSLTTPDPVMLHKTLARLSNAGVTHAAMEASSHGLLQRRLDGVRLTAAAFTNLGRDHMDYHPTVEDYLAAKMRLFDTLMAPGSPAVIFSDDAYSQAAVNAAAGAGLDVRTVGRKGEFIALKRVEHERHSQVAELVHDGHTWRVELPLAGDFQIANALVAAGLALSAGIEPRFVFSALEKLKGAPGRLDLVGAAANGALVYVDYAHKPEALEQVLLSVRPFTTGKVAVVFGCGGDRDAGKRPIMGEIASRLADKVYVTDDNPRSEDPATIRAAIMAAAKGAIEIGDRREAIRKAIAALGRGDTLVIAGKGHETGQTANGETVHFSDHEEARAALGLPEPVAEDDEPLWTGEAMAEAMKARPVNGMPSQITGISIDTRTLQKGDAFFAIKGEKMDGHNFASAAAVAGASVLVVAEEKLPALGRVTVPLMVVDDVLKAMERLGRAARARTNAKIIAVTGSAGKTTTKETLRHVLSRCGRVHASAASFNNHWGVPLTLARMPRNTDYGVFEIGMNHPGEITPLVAMVRPHVAMVTLIAAAHLGHFKNLDGIAHAKAEIFTGVEPGGWALINRDDKRFKLLSELAEKAGVKKIAGYGENRLAQVKLKNAKLLDDCSCATVRVFDEDIAVKVGLPGRHVLQNTLGVLGAAKLVGADMAEVAQSLASLEAPDGRGKQFRLKVGNGTISVIDESYNANPASMEAAMEMLAQMTPGPKGRRIVVLGDMLELGAFSKRMHAGLAEPLLRLGIHDVWMAGPEMAALDEALPSNVHSRYFDDVAGLQAELADAVSPGDIIMIKSSNGIGFSKVVKALRDRFKAAE